ncbi:MAG: PAS domain S-box protein, partial [Bacteroidetes bacterium]|nr:PAS domain S-box protein [Bacteroidota bacterium]
MASILDKLLGTITEEQRQEIKNRWIQFDILNKPTFYERNKIFVWGIAVILAVVFLLAIKFNIYLKKQIRIKTHELVIAGDNAIRNEKASRNLFEKHAAVKLIIDPETGNIVDANKSAATFYGWSEKTLKRMNISQINNLPVEILKKELERARKHKKTFFEFVHRKADGSLVDVEVFSSGIQIGDKEFLHSIVHDISEKKKTEDKLKLLNRAIETSSVSVVITDAEGNIKYTNPCFTELSGYSLNDVVDTKLRILKPGKLSEFEHNQLWYCIHSGKDWVGDYQNRKKNGEFYWEKSIVSPIQSSTGELSHIVSINVDISEKKRMLEELITARDKAEESNRLKSAFLANMSHEIRTPMNGILGFTSLLLEPSLSDETKDEYIRIIHKSGERMLNTVNDIVEISKIEAGIIEIKKSEINVNEVVHSILEFFQVQTQKKGLNLNSLNENLETDIILTTDKAKFESILTNLIKNAIKFTEKGNIAVSCCFKNGFIKFCVKDTGIGIPKQRQAAIFNRFEQADIEDTRVFEGSGLGLAIAKSYVEMLGGEIWVESTEGQGSEFCFTIPNFINEKDKTSNSKTENKDIKVKRQCKILIVEDDETSSIYLKTILNDIAEKITHVSSGEKAIEECKNQSDFDVILMDIKMQGISGFEATKRIREFNKEVIIFA